MSKRSSNVAALTASTREGGGLRLTLAGRFDARTGGGAWRDAMRLTRGHFGQPIEVDASAVDYWDGAGLALLVELQRRQEEAGSTLDISGLTEEYRNVLDLYRRGEGSVPLPAKPRPMNLPETVGRATVENLRDLRQLIAFVGELTAALGYAFTHPAKTRWKDVWILAETTGVNALPIVTIMGFLIGLIIAYQSAMPLRQFGADIFVADLVGVSVIRELGPLITAIILAGRSGSAFAAEIGTMKVNEEINALTTMGLDPVRFLVTPRVLAAVFAMPMLTLFADLAGLVGGAVVMLSLGYPLVAYTQHVFAAVTLAGFAGAMFKCFVFGILIAAAGCLRGLETGSGASAVGASATRAVVSGIVIIVVVDGLFAVLFYHLGI